MLHLTHRFGPIWLGSRDSSVAAFRGVTCKALFLRKLLMGHHTGRVLKKEDYGNRSRENWPLPLALPFRGDYRGGRPWSNSRQSYSTGLASFTASRRPVSGFTPTPSSRSPRATLYAMQWYWGPT